MFGGRSLVLHLDNLAQQVGVRVLCADRPGMGGSTPVPINSRVQVWLETVPVLLKHVGVEKVSLACHSAGTIYALNTLYHFRDILYPKAPYIGLLAPWVDNVYSRTTLMNMASKLPCGIVDGLADVTKFINQRIAPVASWSGGILSSSMGLFKNESALDDSDATDLAERYGVEQEVAREIERIATKFYFAEDISAGNEEAKLCLKKAGAGSWGSCEDYAEFAKVINERESHRQNTNDSTSDEMTKLRLHVWFAESDIMIGKDGQKYFNECWTMEDGCVDFERAELPGTNHETVLLDAKKGGLRAMFEEIGGLSVR